MSIILNFKCSEIFCKDLPTIYMHEVETSITNKNELNTLLMCMGPTY